MIQLPTARLSSSDAPRIHSSVSVLSSEPSTGFLYRVAKRSLDVVLASIALLILFPAFALVALAICLDNPGPVFFRQRRYGYRGRVLYMLKFRSMVVDAEAMKDALVAQNEATGPIFKMKNDPRVTRVGRFIRKTSLDELPQFINVLLGQMSLVGPRPLPVKEVDLCNDREWARHLVRPGLLCYREISGRSRLTHSEWIESDLRYIADRSMRTDCHVLVRAFGAVLRSDGAY